MRLGPAGGEAGSGGLGELPLPEDRRQERRLTLQVGPHVSQPRHQLGVREQTMDPRYADVIVQRWQNLTKQKAVLQVDGRTFEEVAAERREDEPQNPS